MGSYEIFRVFGREPNGFERYLVTCKFDGVLVRPWPSLATLLSRNFELARVGATFQGFLLM